VAVEVEFRIQLTTLWPTPCATQLAMRLRVRLHVELEDVFVLQDVVAFDPLAVVT
jgi:hypothetical protein